uniref:inositol hexakisphosphate and diphosphoinositol-pentakisphosphate kinase 2-like isoform X3 n=1 Tax=Styela clava TaxID=7725 RepID=UPI0019399410|nr:inositol hexakisphosphate and diphosphoinositol-pentakisphosphate kinase 2-like isoform X3 [Styela clava]
MEDETENGHHAKFFIGTEDSSPNNSKSEGMPQGTRQSYELFYRNSFSEDDFVMEERKKIVVGICAMDKKVSSKPMKEILNRLAMFEYLTLEVFPQDVILNRNVEDWPSCDCLISFHSTGFPLSKAVEYSNLTKAFLINDLETQFFIQDRREVYRILKEHGIEMPRNAVCNRDGEEAECNFEEYEDHIVVGNETFHKPFVEKPVDAEDHNIHIYYPSSAGGGCQKLFRKVPIGNRSSQYSAQSSIRKKGSFIYEDFMPTDGTDVKVYTVGPEYAHAEARKSPALDGKVERDRDGKEVRFPVILSAKEKLIARKVCLAFKQTVCGFDFLRAHGKSYVCDVNGFSFVKNSKKYYDDCAKVLGNIIIRNLAPQFHIPWSIPTDDDIPIVPTTSGTMMELRCVIAVIRHGDRTPKQKLKMEVQHHKFWDLFRKYNGHQSGCLKLKRPKQLQEVLDVARYLLSEPSAILCEKRQKLEQLKTVLEMYGHFSGINRKVQFKQVSGSKNITSSSDDSDQQKTVRRNPTLLLILKWGGELTPAGRAQAEDLGRAFRCMYPGGKVEGHFTGDYAGFPGCGLLRLHSTYRHDLKIYASDEGRVQMTAAAFAKGLLALEGELTPILVQMVKSANMNGLLDSEGDSLSECQQNFLHFDFDGGNHRLLWKQLAVKEKLQTMLNQDKLENLDALVPLQPASIVTAAKSIENPLQTMGKVHTLIKELTKEIKNRLHNPSEEHTELYHNETLGLMLQRWAKLEKDFKIHKKRFDISKIPDIYDCIKYDLQHNSKLKLEKFTELYSLSKTLADIVIPQEYGITKHQKLDIALGYCIPLLRKIKVDLERNLEDDTYRLNPRYSRGVLSPGRHVRTRLYFTSESHIHSLLTILRYGGLCNEVNDDQWKRAMEYVNAVSELNYMTQIVIMLYEDPNEDPSSEKRFHVELHFSPGARGTFPDVDFPQGGGFRPASRPSSRGQSPLPKVPERPSSSEEKSRALDSSPSRIPVCITSSRHSVMSRTSQSSVIEVCPPSAPDIRRLARILQNAINIASWSATQHMQQAFQNKQNEKGSERSTRQVEQIKEVDEKKCSSSASDSTFVDSDHNNNTPGTSDQEEPDASEAVLRFLKNSKPHRSAPPAPVEHERPSSRSRRRSTHRQHSAQTGRHPHVSRSYENKGGLGSQSCLFSTKVLAGGRSSSSTPNIPNEFAHAYTVSDMSAVSDHMSLVPSIRALETLHNSLSLKQMNDFLDMITCKGTNAAVPPPPPVPSKPPALDLPVNAFTPLKINPNVYDDIPYADAT